MWRPHRCKLLIFEQLLTTVMGSGRELVCNDRVGAIVWAIDSVILSRLACGENYDLCRRRIWILILEHDSIIVAEELGGCNGVIGKSVTSVYSADYG